MPPWATLSGTSTGGTGTLKRAFVYFEMQASDTAVPPDSIWDAEYDPAKHIIVRPFEMPEKKLAILSAADGDAPYGAFRLSGCPPPRPGQALSIEAPATAPVLSKSNFFLHGSFSIEKEPEPEDELPEDPEPDPVPLEDLINVLVPSSGELVINPYGLE